MTSVSVRSYLAAGVAAVGVGAVVFSAVQPLNPDVPLLSQRAESLAVGLAATFDPITPWTNAIVGALNNVGDLVNNWADGVYVAGTLPMPDNTGIRPNGIGGVILPNNATFNGNLGYRTGGYETGVPLPILVQTVNNAVAYLNELPDIGGIVEQVFGNIGSTLRAPFEAGVNQPGRLDGPAFVTGTLNFNQNVNATPYIVALEAAGVSTQRDIWALLPVLAPQTVAAIGPVLDFATTPISGVLLGAIGPIVGPVISVVNGITKTFDMLKASDWAGALNELINIPANAVNALLNGGPNLDVTGLLNALDVPLPSTITKVGLQMGGLLSPGGVAFDALSTEAEILGIGATIPGLPVGPIGALVGLTNYIATAIAVPPPMSTASVRSAAAEAPAVQSTAPDTTPQVTADRSSDAPAPAVKHRASRKASSADNGGGASASPSAAKPATPKASAARRGAR